MNIHKDINEQHDNLAGSIISQVDACFGSKACQEQRVIDQERQRLENEFLKSELQGGGVDDGGMSTGTLVLLVFLVLLFLGGVIFFVMRKKRRARAKAS